MSLYQTVPLVCLLLFLVLKTFDFLVDDVVQQTTETVADKHKNGNGKSAKLVSTQQNFANVDCGAKVVSANPEAQVSVFVCFTLRVFLYKFLASFLPSIIPVTVSAFKEECNGSAITWFRRLHGAVVCYQMILYCLFLV